MRRRRGENDNSTQLNEMESGVATDAVGELGIKVEVMHGSASNGRRNQSLLQISTLSSCVLRFEDSAPEPPFPPKRKGPIAGVKKSHQRISEEVLTSPGAEPIM